MLSIGSVTCVPEERLANVTPVRAKVSVLLGFHPKNVYGNAGFKKTHENMSILEWAGGRTRTYAQERSLVGSVALTWGGRGIDAAVAAADCQVVS